MKVYPIEECLGVKDMFLFKYKSNRQKSHSNLCKWMQNYTKILKTIDF